MTLARSPLALHEPDYGYIPFADLSPAERIWMTWVGILRLAHKFMMEQVRDIAAKALQQLPMTDPVNCVVAALEFKEILSAQWQHRAMAALCVRAEPLKLAEAERLPLHVVVRIANMRERVARGRPLPAVAQDGGQGAHMGQQITYGQPDMQLPQVQPAMQNDHVPENRLIGDDIEMQVPYDARQY